MDGGQTFSCKARWLFTLFIEYKAPSWLVLFLGVLAALTRSGLLGFLAGALGMIGLIVYAKDYAAVGFLLGVMTLARAQFDEYRHEHRSSQ